MRPLLPLCAAGLLAAAVPAQRFTPGNLLVSSADFLWELDDGLQVVRQVSIPTSTTTGRLDSVDVVVDARGIAHVLQTNAFGPGAVRSYDPSGGGWTSHPVPAFLGNISDGDLSISGTFLYTKSARIELPSFTVLGLPSGLSASEISAGLDGRLLKVDSGLPRRFVRELDPRTFQELASIIPVAGGDIRGVTTLPGGELVTADWNGTLYRFSADGRTLRASLDTAVGSLLDVDAHPDGRLVATSRSGDVVLTDADLSSARTANPSGGTVGGWACFVPELGPNVDAVTPGAGSWRGPGVVSVRGRFFTSAPIRGVTFGGQPATGVTVVDDTTIRCTPPPGEPGAADVVVLGSLAPAALPGGFVYTPGLVTATPVAPGAGFTLDHRLEVPGDFVVTVLGHRATGPRTIPGIDRELLIADPTVLLLAPRWPGHGLSLPIRVPDDPRLLGVEATFQAASGLPGRATWTNAVTVRVAD